MDQTPKRRVEVLVPMRTLLVVAAAIAVMAAFVSIGDTFLIVFVGVFLALVFEYPVRVQLRGRYTTGFANVECMYAPEFNSHSENINLEVK